MADKGSLDGGCFTPGCDDKAKWIAISEPSINADYMHRYRCATCCDLLGETIVREHTWYGTATPDALAEHRIYARQVLNMNRDELVKEAGK